MTIPVSVQLFGKRPDMNGGNGVEASAPPKPHSQSEWATQSFSKNHFTGPGGWDFLIAHFPFDGMQNHVYALLNRLVRSEPRTFSVAGSRTTDGGKKGSAKGGVRTAYKEG